MCVTVCLSRVHVPNDVVELVGGLGFGVPMCRKLGVGCLHLDEVQSVSIYGHVFRVSVEVASNNDVPVFGLCIRVFDKDGEDVFR